MSEHDDREDDPPSDNVQIKQAPCEICHSVVNGKGCSWLDTNLVILRKSADKRCTTCALTLQGVSYFSQWWLDIITDDSEVRIYSSCLGTGISLPKPRHKGDGRLETIGFFGSAKELSLIRIGKTVPQWSTDEVCFKFIRTVVGECSSSHYRCRPPANPGQSPTRILDLSVAPYLLVAGHEMCGPYASLSHRWGTDPVFAAQGLLLRSNLSSRFSQGMVLAEMSATCKDAVEICRRINLRYLWVDQLCIVQDDLDDWARESTTMATIYENAHVVIAASRASSAADGIFHSRNQGHRLFDQNGMATDAYVKPWHHHILHRTPSNLPLLSRGWVFQERLFARRMLHFGHDEIFFECRHGQLCECGHLLNDQKPSVGSNPPDLMGHENPLALENTEVTARLEKWQFLVEKYSEMSLSLEKDRLPAISATARRLSHPDMGSYIAGVFEKSLPFALTWGTENGAETIEARPGYHRHPSWSWISAKGPVTWRRFQPMLSACDVLSFDVALATNDKFGLIERAELSIVAPCAVTNLARCTYTKLGYVLNGLEFGTFRMDTMSSEIVDWMDQNTSLELVVAAVTIYNGYGKKVPDLRKTHVFCIGGPFALVLKPHFQAGTDANSRIGTWSYSEAVTSELASYMHDHFKPRTLRLI